mgnify:CR=1 FL=1
MVEGGRGSDLAKSLGLAIGQGDLPNSVGRGHSTIRSALIYQSNWTCHCILLSHIHICELGSCQSQSASQSCSRSGVSSLWPIHRNGPGPACEARENDHMF